VAERLTLELATPTRLLVTAEADEVVVPGSLGYFGVLPGHAPLLATLGTGEATYRVGRAEHHLAVSGGFVEVRNDTVIILADVAETPGDIDRGRAERARDRAEARLAGRTQEDIDYTRAMCALARALARLQVAGRSHG
jgi:F-type H+-transporting ATPase subunit epsilon